MDGERVADWRHLPRTSGVFARARGEGFLLLCVGGIAQKGERVCCFVSFWLRFVLRYDFRYTALYFPFLCFVWCFGAIGFVSFFGAIRYSSQLYVLSLSHAILFRVASRFVRIYGSGFVSFQVHYSRVSGRRRLVR